MAADKFFRHRFRTIDDYRVVPITVGGATEKDVLEDPRSGSRYIAKLGGRNSDLEVMTEYAIYVVGNSLGLPVAHGRIARYRGRLRFLSQYFLDTRKAEELVHGVQLFRELYDDNTVKGVLGNQQREQAMFSVQAVKNAFGAHYVHYGNDVEEKLFAAFVAMLTHDALIGVQDRHHENWGVIVQRGTDAPAPRFAPLYDSARGLFCNETDAQLAKKDAWNKTSFLTRYVGRARPLFGFTGATSRSGRSYLTHVELLAEVFRAYPDQRDQISAIVCSCDWGHISAELRTRLRGFCSPRRAHLILQCLKNRQRLIMEALNIAP
jgi:hypothetical protein